MTLVLAFVAGAAAMLCGTPTVNLSGLMRSTDFNTPLGVPCSLPECSGGKLPWNYFFNFCQPVITSGPLVANCIGAAAFQQWSGDSASLGLFRTATFADIPGGVLLTATGGTVASGIPRNLNMKIMCSTTQIDAYPTYLGYNATTLDYFFEFNRPEACATAPSAACAACWQQVDFCFNATSSCTCFNKPARLCFQNAACAPQDASLLSAEVLCLKSSCSSAATNMCNL